MLTGFSAAARARVLPFVLFMLLLGLRGALSAGNALGLDGRWIYGLSLVSVGGLLIWFRHEYGELVRQNFPDPREALLAAAVGLAVFGLWIYLDAPWMTIGEGTASFVPIDDAGRIEWPLVALRWCGAALLVPVMEELFWRSFLMRWIENPRFEAVSPQAVGLRAVLVSTFIFVLAHTLWLAAALAGLAYAWLYVRTGKLWTAVIAHAVTNGVLGAWVVMTGRWAFW
ncbi:MAG: CAAX prenyl protease-related protein [Paucibacter sp.]|nr:CAAX prenyl protease-related protein [Roseateles sp.]